jgi:hypothetical protein
MHSVAVCALMVAFARQIGLPPEEVRLAGLAGLMHDMGKAVMPLEVLNKPGALAPAEFEIMKSHPQRGHALLRAGRDTPDMVLDVCLHHHEKIDGSGYPFGLNQDRLSVHAHGAIWHAYAVESAIQGADERVRSDGCAWAPSTRSCCARSCVRWASIRLARWCGCTPAARCVDSTPKTVLTPRVCVLRCARTCGSRRRQRPRCAWLPRPDRVGHPTTGRSPTSMRGARAVHPDPLRTTLVPRQEGAMLTDHDLDTMPSGSAVTAILRSSG